MTEVSESFNAQRLKVLDYLEENSLTNADILRLVNNVENPKFTYRKQDVSNIMNGKRKYTPYVNWFITFVCKAYGIK